jgi:phosphopantetheine--protein transferase-like protein
MPLDVLTGYLSSLLNRSVSASENVSLSSAQRARFTGWLESRGVSIGATAVPTTFDVGELANRFGVARSEAVAGRANLPPPHAVTTAPLMGIGIDIQSVSELIKRDSIADLKADVELRAIFTLRELSYAEAKGSPADTLTGIFAAKEAARKADPEMLRRQLTEIEILPDDQGRPQLPGFAISISHSAGVAVAIAIRAAATKRSEAAIELRVDASVPAAPASRERVHRVGRLGFVLLAVLICAGAAGITWLHALAR